MAWMHGWEAPAAQRLRFVLDFAYATGLRIGELVNATLGQIKVNAHHDHWPHRQQGGAAAAGPCGAGPVSDAAWPADNTGTMGTSNAAYRQSRSAGSSSHHSRASVERHATLLHESG